MTEKAVYFIKFGISKEHLEDLVYKGELFMNCAEYYRFCDIHYNDHIIGDKLEGALFNGTICKFYSNPLYCLYTVFPNDIVKYDGEEYIQLQSKAIKNIGETSNDFAVINADSFIDHLHNADLCNGNFRFGQVEYLVPSVELEARLLADIKGDAVYTKRPKYSYQQEARICLGTHYGTVFSVRKNDGKPKLFVDGKPYRGKVFSLGPIDDFLQILSLNEVIHEDNSYYLPVSKIQIPR